MDQQLVEIKALHFFDQVISATIRRGELVAVIGPNRSGKTTLAKVLWGKMPGYEGQIIRHIDASRMAFSDYSANSVKFHYADFYYQQRYDSNSASVQCIEQFLDFDANDEYHKALFRKVLSEDILQKQLIELSSGETRKVLLLKNLFKPADLFLLDNPFTGLDPHSANTFIQIFQEITRNFGKTVVLLLNDNAYQISFDVVITLKGQETAKRTSKIAIPNIFSTPKADFKTVFQINNAHILAGKKTLIHEASWTIKKGEKWLLRGKNGAGKSTLMSLLNADNPSAYRLGITLFDRKRGTGESIWDIKAKIGFVSPEIQQYWNLAHPVKNILQSGFTDTIFLNRKLTNAERESYELIANFFGLKDMENEALGHLSSGEKRMVMVARALIKNPPVLILDEPFQGLDQTNFQLLHRVLTQCADDQRTIIQIAHLQSEILPVIQHLAKIEGQELNLERNFSDK